MAITFRFGMFKSIRSLWWAGGVVLSILVGANLLFLRFQLLEFIFEVLFYETLLAVCLAANFIFRQQIKIHLTAFSANLVFAFRMIGQRMLRELVYAILFSFIFACGYVLVLKGPEKVRARLEQYFEIALTTVKERLQTYHYVFSQGFGDLFIREGLSALEQGDMRAALSDFERAQNWSVSTEEDSANDLYKYVLSRIVYSANQHKRSRLIQSRDGLTPLSLALLVSAFRADPSNTEVIDDLNLVIERLERAFGEARGVLATCSADPRAPSPVEVRLEKGRDTLISTQLLLTGRAKKDLKHTISQLAVCAEYSSISRYLKTQSAVPISVQSGNEFTQVERVLRYASKDVWGMALACTIVQETKCRVPLNWELCQCKSDVLLDE